MIAAILTLIFPAGIAVFELYFRKSKGEITKKHFWIVSVLTLISFFPAVYLIYDADKKSNATELQLNEKLTNLKDSLEITVEGNKNKVIETFTESLAKWGLKYDSSQKVIQRLVRDSTNRVTNIVNKNEPDINVCFGTGLELTRQTSDSIFFTVTICNIQASAFNVNLKLLTLIAYGEGLFSFPKQSERQLSYPNFDFPMGTNVAFRLGYEKGGEIPNEEQPEVTRVYFRLKGNYRDSRKNRGAPIEMETYAFYDVSTKKVMIPDANNYNAIKMIFEIMLKKR